MHARKVQERIIKVQPPGLLEGIDLIGLAQIMVQTITKGSYKFFKSGIFQKPIFPPKSTRIEKFSNFRKCSRMY